MRLLFWCGVILFIGVLEFSSKPALAAEAKPPLTEDKILMELESIHQLIAILTLAEHNADEMLAKLLENGYELSSDQANNFGLRRIAAYIECAFCPSSVGLNFYFFNKKLAGYDFYLRFSDNATTLKAIDIWPVNNKERFVLDNDGILPGLGFLVTYKNNDIYDDYYQSVANGAGNLLPVSVPENLKEKYEELTSNLHPIAIEEKSIFPWDTIVNSIGCIDHDLIHAFVKAGRLDLIENALNGDNPGGRILAAQKLLQLQKKGRPLSKNVMAIIVKLTKLNVDIGTIRCGENHPYSVRSEKDIRKLIGLTNYNYPLTIFKPINGN